MKTNVQKQSRSVLLLDAAAQATGRGSFGSPPHQPHRLAGGGFLGFVVRLFRIKDKYGMSTGEVQDNPVPVPFIRVAPRARNGRFLPLAGGPCLRRPSRRGKKGGSSHGQR